MQAPLGEQVERRLAEGRLDVPVLPVAAREVLELCDRADCDFARLAAVVKRDPALAAHFLRVANSAAFGGRSSIVSLPQALARLGTDQSRQIALLVACRTRVFDCRSRADAARELRRHAVATALWSQEIARLRRLNVEEAFLCGLLGDIAVPALWQLADELVSVDAAPAVDAVVARLHDVTGADIARQWSLPSRVVEAIRRHHEDLAARGVVATGAGAGVDATVATVQLADALARATTSGDAAVDADAVQPHPSVLALSLYREDLEALVARAEAVRTLLGALS